MNSDSNYYYKPSTEHPVEYIHMCAFLPKFSKIDTFLNVRTSFSNASLTLPHSRTVCYCHVRIRAILSLRTAFAQPDARSAYPFCGPSFAGESGTESVKKCSGEENYEQEVAKSASLAHTAHTHTHTYTDTDIRDIQAKPSEREREVKKGDVESRRRDDRRRRRFSSAQV